MTKTTKQESLKELERIGGYNTKSGKMIWDLKMYKTVQDFIQSIPEPMSLEEIETEFCDSFDLLYSKTENDIVPNYQHDNVREFLLKSCKNYAQQVTQHLQQKLESANAHMESIRKTGNLFLKENKELKKQNSSLIETNEELSVRCANQEDELEILRKKLETNVLCNSQKVEVYLPEKI